MVGHSYRLQDFFDLSSLTSAQQKLVEVALHDLMRSASFMQVIQRMQKQYGRVAISFNPQTPTIANITMTHALLNINPAQLEKAGYVQTMTDGTEQARPMTLQRALAHEIAHFAQDKESLKLLMQRRFATLVQEAILRGGAMDALVAEVRRDYPHFATFFGYKNESEMLGAMVAMSPLDRIAYIEQTEVAAMQLENTIMKELYGEQAREASALAYVMRALRHDKGFWCAVDSLKMIDETYKGESEPCAYGYIPGKQESLSRSH